MLIDVLKQKGFFLLLGVAIFLVLVVIIAVLFANTGSNNTATQPVPSPTPVMVPNQTSEEQKLAPGQKTIIQKTTQQEVENLSNIENVTTLSDGSIKYSFTSPLVTRKNEVVVQNNHVVFERILIPEKSSDPNFMKISDYKNTFGEPDTVIVGSEFYGHPISTYIYASKGFAVVGNDFTDEAFEVQTFVPMSIESYKQLYGDDIDEETHGQL